MSVAFWIAKNARIPLKLQSDTEQWSAKVRKKSGNFLGQGGQIPSADVFLSFVIFSLFF